MIRKTILAVLLLLFVYFIIPPFQTENTSISPFLPDLCTTALTGKETMPMKKLRTGSMKAALYAM